MSETFFVNNWKKSNYEILEFVTRNSIKLNPEYMEKKGDNKQREIWNWMYLDLSVIELVVELLLISRWVHTTWYNSEIQSVYFAWMSVDSDDWNVIQSEVKWLSIIWRKPFKFVCLILFRLKSTVITQPRANLIKVYLKKKKK